MKSEGVYLVGARDCGLTKVGRSKNVGRRTNTLQGASPVQLQLAAFIPGDSGLEVLIHRAAADHWSHREWFKSSAPVLVAIRALSDPKGIVRPEKVRRLLRDFDTSPDRGFATDDGGWVSPGEPTIRWGSSVSIGTRSKVVHPAIR